MLNYLSAVSVCSVPMDAQAPIDYFDSDEPHDSQASPVYLQWTSDIMISLGSVSHIE